MAIPELIVSALAAFFVAVLYVVAFRTPRGPAARRDSRSDVGRSDGQEPVPTQGSYELHERAAMPPEIAAGRLVASERTFWRRGRRPLFAKVDQAFHTQDGQLVLVETKSRMRLGVPDIVQLSAQAAAVRGEMGNRLGRVADYAYVRLQLLGGPAQYRAVRLYSDEQIDQLVDRYHALRFRQAYPLARPHPSRCGTCVFRNDCRT